MIKTGISEGIWGSTNWMCDEPLSLVPMVRFATLCYLDQHTTTTTTICLLRFLSCQFDTTDLSSSHVRPDDNGHKLSNGKSVPEIKSNERTQLYRYEVIVFMHSWNLQMIAMCRKIWDPYQDFCCDQIQQIKSGCGEVCQMRGGFFDPNSLDH